MKFRKKPVVIDAIQWTGDNFHEISMFCLTAAFLSNNPHLVKKDSLVIKTLEGPVHASVGDWIICDVNGEFYPCEPDIFKKTYETTE